MAKIIRTIVENLRTAFAEPGEGVIPVDENVFEAMALNKILLR